MPATESTWRNLKSLHVIFGLSAIGMLAATVWMFAADHDREWRAHQSLYYTRLEVWNAESRIFEQLAGDFQERTQALEAYLAEEETVPSPLAVAVFVAETFNQEAAQRTADERSEASPARELNARYVDLILPSQEYLQVYTSASVAEAQNAVSPDSVPEARVEALQSRQAELEGRLAGPLADFVAAARQTLGDVRPVAAVERAYQNLKDRPSAQNRRELLGRMQDVIASARFHEENAQRDLKFRRAELDVVKSEYDLRTPLSNVQRLEDNVRETQADVDRLQLAYEASSAHRQRLEAVTAAIRSGAASVQRALDQHRADFDRVAAQRDRNVDNLLKRAVQGPILDAFAKSGDIGIQQVWLPELTVDYRHKRVARFDRCVSCHLGIEKTQPGSPTEPAYEAARLLREPLLLATPAEAPEIPSRRDAEETTRLLREIYGFDISDGIFNPSDVMVRYVLPRSAAADAQLIKGDVLVNIDGVKLRNRAQAERLLLDQVNWGQSLRLNVRRGVPQPYATHPRLDLFVGSTSPHPKATFGCTICHDGQGNATEFKWTSHSPNSISQRDAWYSQYGWFNNHFWEYPMLPSRFTESSCIRCHFDMTELDPSDRFPEPPAPSLMHGYHLVRDNGCFGCHEIRGWESPTRRIGPDLRLEPNYASAAEALYVEPDLNDEQRADRFRNLYGMQVEVADGELQDESLREFNARLQRAAQQLLQNPTVAGPRHELRRLLLEDQQGQYRELDSAALDSSAGWLTREKHALASALADVDVPGTMRKVGPSLRYVSSKLDESFLFDWLWNPQNFRPSTRMPRFFGLYDHLVAAQQAAGAERSLATAATSQEGSADRGAMIEAGAEPAHTQQLETAEILGIIEYLMGSSQPFAYIARPEGAPEPSAERGKFEFHTKGCLACHAHEAFPGAEQVHGPELSRIGAKLPGEKGFEWLYSWIRNPTHYHARTKMPNTFLDPSEGPDGLQDPAADIAAFLQASVGDVPEGAETEVDPTAAAGVVAVRDTAGHGPIHPEGPYRPAALPALAGDEALQRALYDVALEELRGSYTLRQSEDYLQNGIPSRLAAELKGDEVELLGATDSAELRQQKMLRYVGRRALSKYGCFGCHDVPGFENAKPIGTGLADWGKKDPARLAFEQIGRYIEQKHGASHGDAEHGGDHGAAHGGHGHVNFREFPSHRRDEAWFLDHLLGHQRTGFLYQKLSEPRSYDYQKTEGKRYNERLRMPQFNFSQRDIEGVMTFVLGLVADPPAEKYVYSPDPRQKAIVDGLKVLEKFNCAGCHKLQDEAFTFEFRPDYPDFEDEREYPDNQYPFLRPHFTPQQIAASKQTDNRGWGRVRVFGSLVVDEAGEVQETEDDEERPLVYLRPQYDTLINGQVWLGNRDQIPLPLEWLRKREPARGGFLAGILPGVLLERQREIDPATRYAYTAALAWGPPPLMREGRKVQPGWLYNFMLDPYPIRPAAVLRMPKFNLSPDDATALVNYFAAVDNETYPYERVEQQAPGYLSRMNQEIPDRLEDAMHIVTNRGKCAACHLIGDFSPGGSPRAQGPNLQQVADRLRPEYLREWLADPPRKLFYTGMPVNIPYHEPIRPKDFTIEVGPLVEEGSSRAQIDALTDLLLNYGPFLRQQQSIQPMINDAPRPPMAEGEGGAAPGAAPAATPDNPTPAPASGTAPESNPADPAESSAPPSAAPEGATETSVSTENP